MIGVPCWFQIGDKELDFGGHILKVVLGGQVDSNSYQCLGSGARCGEDALVICLPQGCQIDFFQ